MDLSFGYVYKYIVVKDRERVLYITPHMTVQQEFCYTEMVLVNKIVGEKREKERLAFLAVL
jgi:hypothetical protein